MTVKLSVPSRLSWCSSREFYFLSTCSIDIFHVNLVNFSMNFNNFCNIKWVSYRMTLKSCVSYDILVMCTCTTIKKLHLNSIYFDWKASTYHSILEAFPETFPSSLQNSSLDYFSSWVNHYRQTKSST